MKKLGLGALLSLSIALSAQHKKQNAVIKITTDGKTKTIKADGDDVKITIVQGGDTTVFKGTHIVKSTIWNDSLSAHFKKELYKAQDFIEKMKAAIGFDTDFHWGGKSPPDDSTAHHLDRYLRDKGRREIRLYEYSADNPAFADFNVKKQSDLEFESLHYNTTSRGFKISFKTKPKPTYITLESPRGQKLYYEKNADFKGHFERDFAFTAGRIGYYLFRVTQKDQSWVLLIDVQ
ncbi:MAG: hypothetical protein V6Z82_00090 [Flavobacteriales bacterium]